MVNVSKEPYTVTITNPLKCFSSYSLIFSRFPGYNFKRGVTPVNGSVGTIVETTSHHLDTYKVLYIFLCDGQAYVLSSEAFVSQIVTLDNLEEKFIEWHHEVGLVEGATDKSQCIKMIEEVIELYCACNPNIAPNLLHYYFGRQVNKLAKAGKFKTVSLADSKAEKIDAVGDLNVVGTNILIRNNVSKLDAMEGVYEILSKRVGHGKMVDGTFVKDKE